MMEKSNKPKNSFLKFLPKAASAVSFQNPPFSPGRDHHNHNHNHNHNHYSSSRLKSHAHKGFSGPINFAVLPEEAREKRKNGNEYDSHEPTSPKVSCMGQIKCKHSKKKFSRVAKTNHGLNPNPTKEMKKNSSSIGKFFSMKSLKSDKTVSSNGLESREHGKIGGKSGAHDSGSKIKGMPSLGQMRKFASGRETLSNFDWTAQIAPIDHDRECFSDEERGRGRDSDEDEDGDENEVIIPFSAPMLLGGRSGEKLNLEPRKEVNLWKRRTMDPPPPLSLKSKFKVR